MDRDLQLRASFKLDPKYLVLEYSVNNSSRNDAYLLNRLFLSAPEWKMNADVIYVQFDRASETILLSKKLANLPAGRNVTSPVAPFVTPVRAGSVFSEKVCIPLPVKEYFQYPTGSPPGPVEPKLLTYKFVRFQLGYYWRFEGTTEEARDISGTEVVLPHTPRGVQLAFGTLESPPTRLDVPVEDFVAAEAAKEH